MGNRKSWKLKFYSKGAFFLPKLAQERAECEKLRERVKSLQEKIKQFKQKSSEDSEGGAGDDKPIVEEVIKEDRVRTQGLFVWSFL